MTSPMQSLCEIFGPGMTWGMYNIGRGLFANMAATLSVDIPSVDASLPSGPQRKLQLARSIVSMKK
ncbi:hypothetical protein K443DRAFT_111761 [Laccaria amethystina LaAM-08-1]|uniref:Uncharacterized protein n=1 Tax=Laccaria amethystina LaAM-08-1 TaxID=1095629 RepID=A0A0C9WXK8_9AGAR|nr:hypothetical protein K443DRAFT_111761 [Laccaria amethystina LaAM-08-1]